MNAVWNAKEEDVTLTVENVALVLVDSCDAKNVISLRQGAWLPFSSLVSVISKEHSTSPETA